MDSEPPGGVDTDRIRAEMLIAGIMSSQPGRASRATTPAPRATMTSVAASRYSGSEIAGRAPHVARAPGGIESLWFCPTGTVVLTPLLWPGVAWRGVYDFIDVIALPGMPKSSGYSGYNFLISLYLPCFPLA